MLMVQAAHHSRLEMFDLWAARSSRHFYILELIKGT